MIQLTIQMLEDNEVEEVNNILTQKQAEQLATYFNEQDEVDEYKAEELVGITIKEAAADIDFEGDYEYETLQHAVCCLYSDKYEGYM